MLQSAHTGGIRCGAARQRELRACLRARLEPRVRSADARRTWVLRWRMLRQTLVLKHVQQCRLSRVIQPEEEDLCVLLREAQEVEHAPEPVNDEHSAY